MSVRTTLLALLASGLGLTLVSASHVARASAAAAAAAAPACSAEAATEGEAVAMAGACGAPVEVIADRSEYQQVFANPSGSRTARVSSTPQRVHRADGSWAAIDPTLVRTAAGWTPRASLSDVVFSNGGSTPFMTWNTPSGASLTLSWPTPLPAPVVSSDHVVYPSVLSGVDLQLTATSTGFKQVLIVRTRAAAQALDAVSLRVGGSLAVERSGTTGLQVVDSSGSEVADSPASSMWDSGVEPALQTDTDASPVAPPTSTADGPGPATASVPLPVDVTADSIVVRPDRSMLTDPNTVFPVFVDPPLTQGRTLWVYANNGNFNTDVNGQMWVGRNPYDGTLYRSLMGFNIGVLDGEQILDAHIEAKLDHSYSCTPSGVYLYRLGGGGVIPGSASTGDRVSWSSAGMPTSRYLGSWGGNANEDGGCGSIQPDAQAVFDASALRSDLQLVADAGWQGYTVGLCACVPDGTGESIQSRWKRFFGTGIYLVATWDTPPNVPTAAAFSTTTDCYKACASPAWVRTATPTLRANVSDDDGGNLSTVFTMRTGCSSSTTLVAQSAGVVVAGGSGTAPWKVPAGKLSAGTYYWSVHVTDEDGLGATSACQTLRVDLTPPVLGAVPIGSAEYPDKDWGPVCCDKPGTFAFSGSDSGSGLADYTWHVDGGSSRVVAAAGGAASATFTPPTDMVHVMYARVRDVAGWVDTAGDASYQFWVTPQPEKYSRWMLDDGSGSTAADTGANDTAMPGALTGGVGLGPDAAGTQVATFTGAGAITTSSAVLDTTRAFTVAAWVRFPVVPTTTQTLLSQGGVNQDRFRLQYDPSVNGGHGGFCFRMTGSDSASASVSTACAPSLKDGSGNPVDVPANQWVQVAGVFDPNASGGPTTTAYFMGGPSQCSGTKSAVTAPTNWSATQRFVIGRGGGSTPTEWLTGELSAVYAFRRPLNEFELCTQLVDQPPA